MGFSAKRRLENYPRNLQEDISTAVWEDLIKDSLKINNLSLYDDTISIVWLVVPGRVIKLYKEVFSDIRWESNNLRILSSKSWDKSRETLMKMPYEIWSCDRVLEIWIDFGFAMKESESMRVASGGVEMLTEHRSNVSLSILNVFSFAV